MFLPSIGIYDDPIHRIAPCFDEDDMLVVGSRDGVEHRNRHPPGFGREHGGRVIRGFDLNSVE